MTLIEGMRSCSRRFVYDSGTRTRDKHLKSIARFPSLIVPNLRCVLVDDKTLEEESGVPTDDALNEMLSRGEDEFILFQQMDAERKAADKAWMNSKMKVGAP